MSRRILTIDPAHPDQRAHTLAARAALVDRMLLPPRGHSRSASQ